MAVDIDFQKVSDLIRRVSDAEIMSRFRNLGGGDVREKGPGDFVTVADEASERALTAGLSAMLPGSLVVGEEAVAKDERVLDRLKEQAPVWIIDPIDGTYNFKEGRSRFGVLVALTQGGRTIAGWCFDAPNDRMAMAIAGVGAFLSSGRSQSPQRLKRAAPDADGLSGLSGFCGGAQAWHFKEVTPLFKRLVNERSSLHDFLDFATGTADFILHKKTTPWDHTAGILLAEEAGGYVGIDADGRYRLDRQGHCLLIAAANARAHRMIYDAVAPALVSV